MPRRTGQAAQQETMRNWAGGRRAFGETGLFVSGLGMGCARLGSSLWQGRSDAAGRASVALAVDLGVSFFDTADVYGRGRSERLLGETLRGRRAAVVMATKCGLKCSIGCVGGCQVSPWRSGCACCRLLASGHRRAVLCCGVYQEGSRLESSPIADRLHRHTAPPQPAV